jgi:hypothetical protein
VSYILDALKKAAEQRDAHEPAMRRLFSPVPEFTESPRWRLAAVSSAAAVAGAVVAVWALWPAASVVIDKPTAPPPVTARVHSDATPSQAPAVPAPAVVPAEPKPAAPAKPVMERRPTPPPAARTRQAPVESPAMPAPAVQTRPAPVDSAPPRQPRATPPPVIAAVRPTPPPGMAVPAATPSTRGAEVSGQLRLEVIVYSDERARRLAFINGRKYVEGDLLADGSRVQEIQPNSVVIIDDGRRVVLKP